MPSIAAVHGMLKADTLRLRRDRFLIAISVYVVGITIAMRWALPVITTRVKSHWDFELTPYHALLVSYFTVQLAPLVPGMIGGFLLLESREDGTVKALLVSPSPLSNYLWVVCLVMFAASAALTVAQSAVIALALPAWPALLAVSLAAAPGSAILALLLAALAHNKVQAFAYLKLFGCGPLLATAAHFVPAPWQWLAAGYPPFCAAKAYWLAAAGAPEWPLWILAGLVCAAVWLAGLLSLFQRVARS